MEEISQKVAEYQNQYYSQNGKNMFFKKAQKQQCAQIIADAIGFEELLKQTVYIVPGTSYVFFSYPLFKSFATPNQFATIVDYVYALAKHCISESGFYEVHIDLNGFTISACERYKEMITLFVSHCTDENLPCNERINRLHIFHCPSVIDQIASMLKPMIEPTIYGKTVLHPKKEGLPDYLQKN
jgi:hypothetical protein